ncbi:5'-nucleotidase domain-containing protein 1-like isoform X1 [Myxocyprinus asiaticus]|uniref:5'-nucleotidase domain-containing protein 1-like isoform X1 n=1 Tax=Myxocyprinus asiaticus TaxID=70543 RepID=UPI0022218B19|nr:5'-nucleotidase domain-containing protein 1-like isoform X1 [Myxocyprinus asiaticus]
MSEYFSLSECDVIGFDLDHTLCRYHLKETSRLIYESFARYLVEHKGYDKELLHLTPATWDFCFKGLVVDLEEGNLIKLADDGTVLRATHGTKTLSPDDITKHYGPKREWKHFHCLNTSYTRSAKYYFYDNYFDLPGALLCARVVDMLHKRGAEITSEFWKDIVAAIDHNYNTSAFREDAGTYFPSVKRNPGCYLQPCSDAVKRWLRSMKTSGKILLLVTSSHSDYCRLVCEHILGMDFEELFDIIITNALKPGFFSLVPQQRPFRTLVDDVEDSEGLPSLEKPGWYSQGNWPHLHELLKNLTNKSEPKVVYFGDSMRSDMFPACSFAKWETVMIVEEMEGEGVPRANPTPSNSPAPSESPVEKKGKFEDQGMKSPSAVSNQWGSYFIDVQKNEGEETQRLTWCCHSIHTYSTMAVPSIEAIADLPLDFKFQRFSLDKPSTTGYYPRPPDSLLKWEQNQS